ncbi:HD-GYP domain-containing protein [Actinospongicola halichondriae]|uniref:HD-GYP domain-containing protein n=1 Tax=Actinospongicola halichondriae TaxID=3236844 RepID=UPI003D50FB1D
MSRVLLVEDHDMLRRATERRLSRGHDVHSARDISSARAHIVAGNEVEVIVTDIDLPDGDGIDLVEWCRSIDPCIGAVVVTGVDDPRLAERVVDAAVQGYLLKPFEQTELDVNIANAARWRAMEHDSRAHRIDLTRLVAERTAEVDASRQETIMRLSMAAESRDPETANHLHRMSTYSALLARRSGLDDEQCEIIRLASPMHDIGKLGIPDEVLTHTGPFDEEQRRIMNRHTEIGWEILHGSTSPLIETAAVIARSHHEWWDGSGHPLGLRHEDIPLEGRIVAIADVFDALTSQRRYKAAMTIHEAATLMRAEQGSHFDPHLLDLFLDDLDPLAQIQTAYADSSLAPC